MATADTARSELHYAPETTWAVLPAADTRKHLRFTGESLAVGRQTVQSDEIRADRQITDLVATRVDSQGSVEGELSYGTYDDFIESAMYNSWVVLNQVNYSVTGHGSLFSRIIVPLAAPNKPWMVNQMIRISNFSAAPGAYSNGATQANREGVFIIKGIRVGSADVSLDVVNLDGSDLLGQVNASVNPLSYDIDSACITNGKTQKSFYIEKFFADVTEYITFRGMVVNQLTLTLEAESLITMSMGFMGRRGKAQSTPEVTGDIAPAPSGAVMNGGDNVAHIRDATGKLSPVTRLTVDINNNLRQKPALEEAAGIGIGAGRFALTGSIATYFEDFDLYQRFQNNTEFSLQFAISRPGVGGGTYFFYMPRVKLSEMTVNSSGPDADVVAEASYQALRDPQLGYTCIISKA